MQDLLKRSKLMLVVAFLSIGLIAAACGPAEDPATTPGTTAPATTPADPAVTPGATDPVTPAPTTPGTGN